MSCENPIVIDGDSSEVVVQLEVDAALVVDGESGGVIEVSGVGF